MDHSDKTDRLKEQYGSVATGRLSNDEASVRAIATSFGYTESELSSLPTQANMGLSCGNPLALAGLREGEVVVDLGCGGGLDVFLAAQRVGSTGRVIGVDMTAAMLQRARDGQRQLGLTNVEFLEANLIDLPITSEFVDCVISNCVINLVPDKAAAFREKKCTSFHRRFGPSTRFVLAAEATPSSRATPTPTAAAAAPPP